MMAFTSKSLTPGQTQWVQNLRAKFSRELPTWRDCLPLKIGVLDDLLARFPDDEPYFVRTALIWHCRSTRYLQAMLAGGQRYDLDGHPAGDVTEQHQEHAGQLLTTKEAVKAARLAKMKEAAEPAPVPAAEKPVLSMPRKKQPEPSTGPVVIVRKRRKALSAK